MANKYYAMMEDLMVQMTQLKDRFAETHDLRLVDEFAALQKVFDVVADRYMESEI